MDQFAKLFECPSYGQICVMKGEDSESKPAVNFYFMPENLGVCNMSLSFDDTDEGWDRMEEMFDKVDLSVCRLVLKDTFDMLEQAKLSQQG